MRSGLEEIVMKVRSEARDSGRAAQMRGWQTFGASANVPVNYNRFIRASGRRVFLSTDTSGFFRIFHFVDPSSQFKVKPNVHYF